MCFLTCSAGVLSQFSPPSGDICPGSDIQFSCVGNSLSVSNTRWEITPDGGEPACIVAHNQPDEMLDCGPGEIFTSSLTGQTGVNYTSSLRAEDVPLSLSGTVVECWDGADLQTIGSANICIVGKSTLSCDVNLVVHIIFCSLWNEWYHSPSIISQTDSDSLPPLIQMKYCILLSSSQPQ